MTLECLKMIIKQLYIKSIMLSWMSLVENIIQFQLIQLLTNYILYLSNVPSPFSPAASTQGPLWLVCCGPTTSTMRLTSPSCCPTTTMPVLPMITLRPARPWSSWWRSRYSGKRRACCSRLCGPLRSPAQPDEPIGSTRAPGQGPDGAGQDVWHWGGAHSN